jgi:hypothetical protein
MLHRILMYLASLMIPALPCLAQSTDASSTHVVKVLPYKLISTCPKLEEQLRTEVFAKLDVTRVKGEFIFYCWDSTKKFVFGLIFEPQRSVDDSFVRDIAEHIDQVILDGNKLKTQKTIGEFLKISIHPYSLPDANNQDLRITLASTYTKKFFWNHSSYKTLRDEFERNFQSSHNKAEKLLKWVKNIFPGHYHESLAELIDEAQFIDVIFDHSYLFETGEVYQLFNETFTYDCRGSDHGACVRESQLQSYPVAAKPIEDFY